MTSGLSQHQLARLTAAVEADIGRGLYHGAVLGVARHGEIGLLKAIGAADAAREKPLATDSVFSIFSVTKAFTNLLVFQAIERGELALTTRVSDVIPEFGGGLRASITFYHLLTHSSGLPPMFGPGPGRYIDRFDEVLDVVCRTVHSECPPGERVTYAPMAAHVLMAEAVRRVHPKLKSYREIVTENVFKPLGMRDTAIGVRRDLKSRHIVPDMRGNIPAEHLGHSNFGPHGAFEEEHAEMPWVGAISTVPDLLRYADMLRRGGELEGTRLVSRAMLEQATINRTGHKPNELYAQLGYTRGWEAAPAYIGLGFFLRGEAICHHQFGTLASPRTHGHQGAGSSLVWVDPARDLVFVMLSAGVLHEADNVERCQRLSDIVHAAAE